MILTATQVYQLHLANAAVVAPKYGMDATTMAQYATAVAWVESKFDTSAHAPSPHTATGLMQINKATKQDGERLAGTKTTSMDALYDPAYNSLLSLHIMGMRMKKCGYETDKGIVAYNQGNCGKVAMLRGASYLTKWRDAMRRFATIFNNDVIASAAKEWY